MKRSAALTLTLCLAGIAALGCSTEGKYRDPAANPMNSADPDFKGFEPRDGGDWKGHPLHISADIASFSTITNRKQGRDLHPFVHVGGEGMGAEIFFASDSDGMGFDIYKKNPVGSAIRKVTSMKGNELWPTISADGRWMAFGSDMKGNFDIFIMDLWNQSAAPVNVTTGHSTNDIHPTWSPDGTRLVYASYSPTSGAYVLKCITLKNDNTEMSAANGTSTLAMGDLDGELPRHEDPATMAQASIAGIAIAERATLTSNQGRVITGIHPDFRPSGEGKGELVYQDYVRSGKQWNTIKLFNLDNGFITQIPITEDYGAIQPRWSPDGKRIIFATVAKMSQSKDENSGGGDGFAITDAAGAGVQDLRNPTDRDSVSDPIWVRVMGEDRLYFTAANKDAEVVASVRLTNGN